MGWSRTPPRVPNFSRLTSHRVVAVLSGPDANHLVQRGDEDLAISDLPRMRLEHDRLDRGRQQLVFYDQIDLELGQKVNHVLRAAIHLGVPLLSAESLHLVHREARYPDALKFLLNRVER